MPNYSDKEFQKELNHNRQVPKVYTASKLNKADLWKEVKLKWQERIEFTARWVNYVGIIEDTPENSAQFWRQDFEDIFLSDFVLVYAVKEDKLRGALVEAGAAIILGKTVVVVGEHPDYGTWSYHKNVVRLPVLIDAFNFILQGYEHENGQPR